MWINMFLTLSGQLSTQREELVIVLFVLQKNKKDIGKNRKKKMMGQGCLKNIPLQNVIFF